MVGVGAAVAVILLASLVGTVPAVSTNSTPPLAPRAGALVGYVPAYGTTLLFGGTTGSSLLNDAWEFNAALDRWALLSDGKSSRSPTARTGHAGGVVGSRLFVFGGQQGDGQLLNDAWLFDPTTAAWSLLATNQVVVPLPRSGHSVAVVNATSFLVFGGVGSGTSILSDVWAGTIVGSTSVMWAPVHAGQSGGDSSSAAHPRASSRCSTLAFVLTLNFLVASR
jgi:hypothetical protein